MRLAALDLGSNSFHLLVAQRDQQGNLREIGSAKDVLRLGSVVQQHGQLTPRAFADAFASVERLAKVAAELGAEKLLAVATSALRDAKNGARFCSACRDQLGVEIDLLSGEQEGRLVYLGAHSGLSAERARLLVADIGGGSLELAAGTGDRCEQAHSLPLGFLRLARRFGASPGSLSEELLRNVTFACERACWRLGRHDVLVLSGGTARAIAKLLGKTTSMVSASALGELCLEVALATPTQLRKAGVAPTRVDTLGPGAQMVVGVLRGLGSREVRIASGGLREGILLAEMAGRRAA